MNMGHLEHFGDTVYSFVKHKWYEKVAGTNGILGDQLNVYNSNIPSGFKCEIYIQALG